MAYAYLVIENNKSPHANSVQDRITSISSIINSNGTKSSVV